MARQFDTDLKGAQRTLVIGGVIQRLAPLLKPTGYLNAIVHYAGVIREGDDDQIGFLIDVLQGRAPAIAVAVGDKTYAPAGVGGFKWSGDLDVWVYFMNNTPRSREYREVVDVVGANIDAADPGLHIAMEHAEELLIGQALGIGASIKEMRPVREVELAHDNQLALWGQLYRVTVARSINEHRDVTQLLVDIITRYNLPVPDDAANPIITTETDIP